MVSRRAWRTANRKHGQQLDGLSPSLALILALEIYQQDLHPIRLQRPQRQIKRECSRDLSLTKVGRRAWKIAIQDRLIACRGRSCRC